MAKMNSLVSWHLKKFCKQHEIDVHEIDNTLTYGENKRHLEEFTIRSLEELAQVYGKFPYRIEQEPIKPKKKWIPFPSKQRWITISRTRVENVTLE